ncbi:major facilitator superfamily domain-containing protein [Myxozyma melibiosi]|uniref:Major facilitator superfamily domain-containing protein n=1 Tax=Myxozyma melibiosi TaxID=54550 RepID=A0ABR1F2I5_9ASCO
MVLSSSSLVAAESSEFVNEKVDRAPAHVHSSESQSIYAESQPGSSSHTIEAEERPEVFTSNFHEAAAVLVLTFSTVMNTASTGVMQIAVPALGRYFGISGGDLSWSVSSFQLMSGATILLFSGIADRIGRKRLVVFAYFWFALWCLIGSFTTNHIIFDVCRGMQGIASAACPSAGVGILGSTYKNGRRKNRVMAVFNAGAPIGAFLGVVTGGVTIQYINWRSIFYLYAIVYALLTLLAIFIVPGDNINDNVKLNPKQVYKRIMEIDLVGALMSITGCIGFVLAASQASSASKGWATPYVLIVLILSIAILCLFVWWESRVQNPLMPLKIWRAPGFAIVMLLILFAWMGFTGVLNFYGGLYLQDVMGASAIKSTLYLFPQTLASIATVSIVAAFLHVASGRLILVISSTLMLVASLLWALVPVGAPYYAMVLPAICLEVVSADLAYNVVNLHTLSTVSKREQSTAAGIFYTISHVAGSLGVSLSTSIVSSILNREVTAEQLKGVVAIPVAITAKAYKGAFWFSVATSAASLVCAVFAKVGKQGARPMMDDEANAVLFEDEEEEEEEEGDGAEGVDELSRLLIGASVETGYSAIEKS